MLPLLHAPAGSIGLCGRTAPRRCHCLLLPCQAAKLRAQQQLLFCVAMDLPSPGRMVLAGLFMAGSRAMRFLISAAIVMKAWGNGPGWA